MSEKSPHEISIEPPEPHSDKQKILCTAFQYPGIREIWIAAGTKFGKACHILELIPTLTGYRLFRDIKEEDYVFDETGNPTKVIYATDIMHDHNCYSVNFVDGQSIICDEDHLWFTETHTDRKNKERNKNYISSNPIKTTLEILSTISVKIGHKFRPNHSIPLVRNPIKFRERDLLIDPYVLGAWLGDGSKWGGSFTSDDIEIVSEIENRGFYVKKNKEKFIYCIHGLENLLKKYDLILNKHIPYEYLVSSPSQRLSLLQGLMDTDGTISKKGDCCFDNTNLDLVDGVEQIAISLGIKTNRGDRIGKLYGKEHKICYRVWFTTDLPVFRIKRKFDRLRKISPKSKNRYIESIQKVDSVPVKCIKVESKNHLFLIGKGCIPTHNTLGATIAQVQYAISRPGTKHRWVAPIYSQTRQPLEYFQKILPPPPGSKRNKSENTIVIPRFGTRFEFWHSQSPSSLEGEGVHSYVFDEAAKQPPEIRSSARTTTTATKGSMIFISYPYGKNWFYTGCMEAKEEMEWAQKKGIQPEKIFLHARTIDNPTIDPIVIENAKRELPNNLFRQFYLAEFIDEYTVFGDINPCIFGNKLDLYGDIQQWYAEDYKEAHVVIGVDWAKSIDFTVFIAIDMAKYRVCGVMRFQKRPYTQAVKMLSIFSRKFSSVENITHDKTGVGVAIDEHLAYINQPYSGVTLTNSIKNEFVIKLITAIEQKQIGLPNWVELKNELKAYECTPNKIGTMTYNGASGKHDDIVSALFLANYSYLLYADTKFEVSYLDELGTQSENKSELEKYYQDIINEDDY